MWFQKKWSSHESMEFFSKNFKNGDTEKAIHMHIGPNLLALAEGEGATATLLGRPEGRETRGK